METQEILNKETGTKEIVTLKPKTVKIVSVEAHEIGEKKNVKLVCNVKHPDKEETIQVSSVKQERNGKLQITGLWVNLDEDKNIRKGSALSEMMKFLDAKTPKDLEGKEVATTEDEKGYLCFKCY